MLLKLVIDGVGYYQHCINGNVGDIFTNWKDIKYQNDLLLLKIRKSEERKQMYGKSIQHHKWRQLSRKKSTEFNGNEKGKGIQI